MTHPPQPKFENAPGVVVRETKTGWRAFWQARSDLVARGFTPKTVKLWSGQEPSPFDRAYIAQSCDRLQSEMLVYGRGGDQIVSVFDGTLIELIRCYQRDADSSYRKLRYRTRENYDSLCRRIDTDHGGTRIEDIKARNLLRWHEEWIAEGHVAMGHSLIGMLRTLFGFGATILEDAQCERLCSVMHKMRFKMAKQRNERLTAEQANAVRKAAHAAGLHSIALAQAIQFECMLRQKDVIGEWVPQGEPGTSDVIAGNDKWLRGIRWSGIDENLVLRHTTSKRQKDVEVNLRDAPMVMEEFARLGVLPASGPVIVYEATGRPYLSHQFRRVWREIATAAGVPKTVMNMDSRAGAISEATDAGAELEHIRHAATHSDIAMTQRYSRGSAEKAANVLKLRATHRNKTGT